MFYAVSSSMLGTYEAVAISTRRLPTLSTWAARRRVRRLALVLWTIGLVVHVARAES